MKSLTQLYRIGRGPSSSHTMGPERAAKYFEAMYPDAASYAAVLYGSLASTGRGHGTDRALQKTFSKPVEVIFDMDTPTAHPNTLDLIALDGEGKETARRRVVSTGGGAIEMDGVDNSESDDVYPHRSFEQIKLFCEANGLSLAEYVYRFEGEGIKTYLRDVWRHMEASIYEGLVEEGELPGGLRTRRRAKVLFDTASPDEEPETRENRLVCAYAFAVSERNAAGETIVTAPTCGSCGIVPSVLKYEQIKYGFGEDKIIDALAVAGLIGNIVKTNASISGAECGCQAECGTACSMAAAAAAQLGDMSPDEIEYAAEVAMEHHLGLTCDPVDGLVQIPCIERNAVAAMRAINAVSLAHFLTSSRQISFDAVVRTMYQTGKDINSRYRETAAGGLAQNYTLSRLSSRFVRPKD